MMGFGLQPNKMLALRNTLAFHILSDQSYRFCGESSSASMHDHRKIGRAIANCPDFAFIVTDQQNPKHSTTCIGMWLAAIAN
mmetsp:Transcript_6808/g.11694  ORF Transcript_6808/g.11694 Transcript_6808/m.11694 type:complete len:82 (-) Transcript_6808:336-581(-)